MGVDQKQRRRDGASIRKLTPLEQAVAMRTDPRRRWDARKEAEGFKRTSIMGRSEFLPDIRAINRLISGEGGEEVGRRLREFVAGLESEL